MEPIEPSLILQKITQHLQSHQWLTSNNIVTPQFINYFILLLTSIESKLKNVDITIDFNSNSIDLVLYIPFLYKLKFHPLLKYAVFFLPHLKLNLIQTYLTTIFPNWKIFIHIN